jgi:hypothetical protein
VRGQDFPD